MKGTLQFIVENKKISRLVGVFILAGMVLVFFIVFLQKNQITQIVNEITIEAGNEFELKGNYFFDTAEENYEKIVFDTEDVDVNTVGIYEAEAKFGEQVFKIKVNVQDTTAPVIDFVNRYIFTCDVKNIDNIVTMLEGVYEVSEFFMNFIRFEKMENLRELNIEELERLEKKIDVLRNKEQLLTLGTENIPEEEGIYRAVLEIIDIYGNVNYEEVVLVLDKTGAYIEEVPDKVIEVSQVDLEKEPEINKEDYKVIDNVDGEIVPEFINFELELTDEDKHEWMVHVSYIDRAGNESRSDFLVVIKEKEEKKHMAGVKETDRNMQEDKENESSNTNNRENIDENLEINKPDNRKNQNENEWMPVEDENDISPWEQKVIDAGYGNVVDFGNGAYGVLTHNDGYADGKRGGEILREYLAENELEPQNISGGVIDEENDWRWYIADNIQEMSNDKDDW